eukprot:349687-Chlamydomonas_euryale.AAC.5
MWQGDETLDRDMPLWKRPPSQPIWLPRLTVCAGHRNAKVTATRWRCGLTKHLRRPAWRTAQQPSERNSRRTKPNKVGAEATALLSGQREATRGLMACAESLSSPPPPPSFSEWGVMVRAHFRRKLPRVAPPTPAPAQRLEGLSAELSADTTRAGPTATRRAHPSEQVMRA